jgi:hypothetical protein
MNANCASYPKVSLGLAARCRQSSQVKCPMPEPHLVLDKVSPGEVIEVAGS